MVSSSRSRTVFFGPRCEHTVASLRVRGPVGLEASGTSLGPLKEIALERRRGKGRKEREREREREREETGGPEDPLLEATWPLIEAASNLASGLNSSRGQRCPLFSLASNTEASIERSFGVLLAGPRRIFGHLLDSRNFCEFFNGTFDLGMKFGS